MSGESPHRSPLHELEQPRHIIVSARISPTAELARWLFERYRIPYHEEAHAPLLHVLATRRRQGGVEVPVVVSAEATWKGAREVLSGLDATLRDDERLFGSDEADRAAAMAIAFALLDRLVPTVRRFVSFHLLPHKQTVVGVAVEAAPMWEQVFVRLFYPLWRRLMARALDFDAALIDAAPTQIRGAFDIVETELHRRGTRYLGGTEAGALDIVFAALAAPIVFPEKYGSRLPSIEELPTALRSFVDEMRGRRAGQLVLDTYATARPPSQPPLPARSRGRPLTQRLLTPRVQRIGARLAVLASRVLVVRKIAVVSRWPDVQTVLHADLDFGIAPVNGPHIGAINGPFILSLDRGELLARERPLLYEAVSRIDLETVRGRIAAEADHLLDTAATHGRIDVGHGYARLVAARTAVHLFGIPGPTEADLMRVCRAMFHHAFLNVGDDPVVAARGLRASEELRDWILREIARRRSSGDTTDDVLGRLMRTRSRDGALLDDDGVRRNLAGLLVGAIDTTSVAVASIVAVLTEDSALLTRVEADLGDRERMVGWCYEALRRRPQAALVLRRATHDVTLCGKSIPGGTLIAAFTQAAMFDAAVFPNPGHLDPSRSTASYLHFGGGMHPCAGRDVNAVQLPALVGRLVARGIERAGPGRFDGPFLDELVVAFRRPHS